MRQCNLDTILNSRLYRLLTGVLVCAAVAYIAVMAADVVSLRRSIAGKKEVIEDLLAKTPSEAALLQKRELLRNEYGSVNAMFYRQEEMDDIAFGLLMRELLHEKNISIERFRKAGTAGGGYFEISVSGPGTAVFDFLRAVSSNDKYLNIPYIQITADGERGVIKAVFRITYETID